MTMPPLILLAGGLATRMLPLTQKKPKSLLDVAGKPFIFHQLEWLKIQGISKVIIALGHLGEQVENLVGNGQEFGIEISYSYDGEILLGTGGALKKACKNLKGFVIVMYGDSYLQINLNELLSAINMTNYTAIMSVIKNNNKWDKSNVVYFDGKVLKHSKIFSKEMQYIDYGISIINSDYLRRYHSKDKFDLSDLYGELAISNQLLGYEAKKRFYEVGSQIGLRETKIFLQKKYDINI